MRTFAQIVWWLAELWVLCAFARAIITWFPLRYGSPAQRANAVLVRVTEPVIAPVRRALPMLRMGGVGVDLSYFLVVIVVQILLVPLRNYAFS